MPLVAVALTAALVAALLLAERYGSRCGKWVAKPLASAGFIAVRATSNGWESSYGRTIFVALLLSWLGDVLLLPKGTGRAFRAGVMAFLLGHLAFGAAFLVRGISPGATAAAAVTAAAVGLMAGAFFVRRAEPKLRAPITAYIAVLSAMVTLAAGTYAARPSPVILAAALAFYCSDLSVALDRFVRPSFWHRAWGLPLYYAAQIGFALSH